MAVTQEKILIRRGNKSDLVVGNLQPGEPVLCLDTDEAGIKTSGGSMLWAPMLVAKDDSIGNTHYEKYADGRVHEWGTYEKDIAYTVKYGETMWFHSDTNDTSVVLPVQIDTSKSYAPNVSFATSGIVWCANTTVQNTSSGGNTVSTLYYRTVSGSQQTVLPVEIHWDIWGFWK